MAYFETGLIVVKGDPIKVMDITITSTKELTPIYNSDSKKPDAVRDGRIKVEFTIKRYFDGTRLSKMFERGCEFAMVIYNNDVQPPQKIAVLEGCKLAKDAISITGDKPATQDIDGQASVKKSDFDKIQEMSAGLC